jgi:chromosome segregation ATPase
MQFLAEDIGEVLNSFDMRISAAEGNVRNLQVQEQEMLGELKGFEQGVRECENRLRVVADRQKKLLATKRVLDERRDGCNSISQVDTSGLEREREDRLAVMVSLQQEIERLVVSINSANGELDVATEEKKAFDKKYAELKKKIDRLNDCARSAQGRVDEIKKKLEACRQRVLKKEKALDDAKADLERNVQSYEAKEAHARSESATRLGERWNGEAIPLADKETADKMKAVISSKKNLLQKGLVEAGLQGRTKEDFTAEIAVKDRDYQALYQKYSDLYEVVDNLETDYKERMAAWNQLLKNCKKTVRTMFNFYLQKKGFSGDLKFSDESSTLHIICQTDNKDKKTRCDDVRQLSGGERSYTTLSFLMALGHVVCMHTA